MSNLKTELVQLSDRDLTVSEATLRTDMERVERLTNDWEPEPNPTLKTYRFAYAHLASVTKPCPTFEEYLDMSVSDTDRWFDAVCRLNPGWFPGQNPTAAAEKPPAQP